MKTLLAASLVLLATSVSATETEAQGPAEPVDIGPAEWSDMASGRTISYAIDGEVWAREYYAPTGDRVVLKFNDGSCLNGSWDYTEPLFCFHWEGNGTSCFRHVRLGGAILVLETEQGAETGGVQIVAGVEDVALDCSGDLTS